MIIVFNLVRQLKCLKKLSEVKEKKKRNKQTDQLEKEKEMEALACKSIKEHLLTLKNPDCVLDAHLKNDGLNSPKRI